MPALSIDTLVPLVVQTDGVFDRYETVRPDVALASGLIANTFIGEGTNDRVAGDCARNMMACEAGLRLIISVALPGPPALLAEIVTGKVPPTVGVPEIKPVDMLTVRPAGSISASKPVGELVAVIW